MGVAPRRDAPAPPLGARERRLAVPIGNRQASWRPTGDRPAARRRDGAYDRTVVSFPTVRAPGRPGRKTLGAVATVLVGVGLSGVPDDGDQAVEVLVDHAQVLPAALEMVRSAREEVLFSMYLLGGVDAAPGDPAGFGREMVDALLERQRAGVRVRVLNTRFRPVADPRAPESVVPGDLWFHPVFDEAERAGLPILAPAHAKGAIDHTKYLVVDGTEAMFGGMNFGDAVASNHDVMVRVSGPVAAELQALFAEQWAAAVERTKGKGPKTPVEGPPTEAPDVAARLADRAARALDGVDGCAIRLLTTSPKTQAIRPAMLDLLAGLGAGDTLSVSMLLLSEKKLVDGLIAAHARGARVRAMLDPNTALYGVDCEASTNARAVARLSEAGVPVRWYAVAPGQEMHMKVLLLERADGSTVFGVGSANWTGSDMVENWEVYGLFSGCPDPAARIAALLHDDWERYAREVSEDELADFRDADALAKRSRACSERLRKVSWLRGRR